MQRKLRYSTRSTKKLKEIVDSDLLTATERIVMGTMGGFYAMSDEEAYFKTYADKPSMSVDAFERKLKTELHPNFFVVFNPNITRDDKIEGHQMGFYVPEYKAFVPLCKVGKSAQREIPANSQGKMVKIKKDRRGETESAVVFRGYIAAFEAAKAFINDVQVDGIKPSRCISSADFFAYKRMVEKIGGPAQLHAAFEEGRKMAFEHAQKQAQEEAKIQEEATKNVEVFLNEIVETQKDKEI